MIARAPSQLLRECVVVQIVSVCMMALLVFVGVHATEGMQKKLLVE